MAGEVIFRRIAGESAVFDQVNEATRYLAETVALIVGTLDPDAALLAGSLGARIHDNTALLATFRSTLESRHMGFADNLSILEPAHGAESAVRGAILRVLSERLVPWARAKLAAISAPAASAARSAKDDRQGSTTAR